MSDFDRWQSRFAATDYVFGTEPNAYLKAEAHRLEPGMKVLCIADGEARNGVFLAEQGMQVTSQDFSPNAQTKARALAEKRGVMLNFVLADITKYDWPDGTYDAVVGIFFQFLAPGCPRRRVSRHPPRCASRRADPDRRVYAQPIGLWHRRAEAT